MRWEALFADMQAQLDAAATEELTAQVAELTRAERAGVHLADRLRAATGERVRIAVRSGDLLDATVLDVGSSWALVRDPREHVVPLHAITSVAGLGTAVAPPPGVVLRRLGLGHVLRALARDRQVVHMVTGTQVHAGRIDGVGADHVELAGVYPDSARPNGERRLVAFDALDLVRAS